MPDGTWTIKKLLDWSSDHLEKTGIESPRLESEILLSHALKLKRIDLYIKFEQILDKAQLAIFKENLIRRKSGEPTAYITGTKAFMSLDLKVTKDVLIPRPETELLVETAIDIAKTLNKPNILDIGTGSGAIAISLAKYIDNVHIHATDISAKAIEIAKENAHINKVEGKISFERADLFPSAGKFDIIISNPPYIKTGDIARLQPEIKNHEPAIALDGGSDGLKYYKSIIENAKNYLNSDGHIIMEIDPGLTEELIKLIKIVGFGKIEVKKDLNGFDRVINASL